MKIRYKLGYRLNYGKMGLDKLIESSLVEEGVERVLIAEMGRMVK